MRFFNNLDDLIQSLEKNQEDKPGPETKVFVPGAYYARLMPNLRCIIYGEILDPVQEEMDAGGTKEEIEYIQELYSSPHMQNYRFTRSYSTLCPEGEYGDVHISTLNMVLTLEEFLKAKKAGWPPDPKDLLKDILGLREGSVGSA